MVTDALVGALIAFGVASLSTPVGVSGAAFPCSRSGEHSMANRF
jgi:hypothetical protein